MLRFFKVDNLNNRRFHLIEMFNFLEMILTYGRFWSPCEKITLILTKIYMDCNEILIYFV
jgi:hypothetical protein